MYEKEGAKIVTHEQAWEADLVIKVKEPHKSEYQYFKKTKSSGILTFSIFKRNCRKCKKLVSLQLVVKPLLKW